MKMCNVKKSVIVHLVLSLLIAITLIVLINMREIEILEKSMKDLSPIYFLMFSRIFVVATMFFIASVFIVCLFDKEIHYDHLTGLYNRKKLYTDLKRTTLKKDEDFTLCYIDFNEFKYINDEYGHEAGDFLLKEFAKRVKSLRKKGIECYRIGGDEFVIIIKKKLEETEESMNLIRSISENKILITSKTEVKLSFAMGYTQNDYVSSPEALVKRADKNMYRDKKA